MSYAGSSPGHSLYPATVQQLLRAKQAHSRASFVVDAIKLDMVTCIAGIVDMYESNSSNVYVLEDGTAGRLRVRWSLNSEPDPLKSLKEHMYVRVTGRLRVFNSINELSAIQIRPVLDMHELFFHCLEAMVAFTSKQRVNQSESSPASPSARLTTPDVSQHLPSMQGRAVQSLQAGRGIEDDSDLTVEELGLDSDTTLEEIDRLTLIDHHSGMDLYEPVQQRSPPLQSLSRSSSIDLPPETNNLPSLLQDPYSSLNPVQRDIMIRIQDNALSFPDGVPIQAIQSSMVRESEIWQAIEDMMDDGLLYSTVDQYHFRMVD
ncbi:hypothetical protein BJV74DRAFT_802339 [Russula compacta]|nr:hypothetical protein BJV74DRAFT_802339 [Russula compacta]